MSVAAVRAAMGAALNGVSGLRCNADGLMRDKINPPEAMVDYEVGDRVSFAGPNEYTFHAMVFDLRTSERAAQARFDVWKDPTDATSVWYALENNAGIAAACNYARVRGASQVQAVTIGSTDYLMVDFTVEVVL